VRLALALASGALIVVGAGMAFLPLGLVVAGAEGLCALYVWTRLEARR
jgi:hypothetical protein